VGDVITQLLLLHVKLRLQSLGRFAGSSSAAASVQTLPSRSNGPFELRETSKLSNQILPNGERKDNTANTIALTGADIRVVCAVRLSALQTFREGERESFAMSSNLYTTIHRRPQPPGHYRVRVGQANSIGIEGMRNPGVAMMLLDLTRCILLRPSGIVIRPGFLS
jgi:hypothetical protein